MFVRKGGRSLTYLLGIVKFYSIHGLKSGFSNVFIMPIVLLFLLLCESYTYLGMCAVYYSSSVAHNGQKMSLTFVHFYKNSEIGEIAIHIFTGFLLFVSCLDRVTHFEF